MYPIADPAKQRNMTEAINQEIIHQERNEHEKQDEEELERDKSPSQTRIQQKTSCRRKMILHTRTDDFL
jgi:hypothetical protein